MVSGARYLFLALVWAYLAGILVQVFLIGIALFGAAHDFEPHINLGWILHLVPILLLIVGAVARVGSRLLWWTLALAVVQFIQPILATLRTDQPVAAAFHPVLAVIIFWMGVTIGLQAWRLVRQPALEMSR
jgi:putative tricarboxylic transport membrane protein